MPLHKRKLLLRLCTRARSASAVSERGQRARSVGAGVQQQLHIKKIKLPKSCTPLQFMSTSMPMTCASSSSQEGARKRPGACVHAGQRDGKRRPAPASLHAKLDVRQLIPRIVLVENEGALRKCCAQTLERICSEYDINPLIPVFHALREFTKDTTESQSSLVALFFLSLDIDVQLKQAMLEAESAAMQRKLTGFFIKLRNDLIPAFLCEEPANIEHFVRECQEAYVLA
jgi:hypothetical protein